MAPDKHALYASAQSQIGTLLAGTSDTVAAMASVAAVLYENLTWVSWVGFYRVVEPKLLRIGPYQGPVGCLEIAFSQGVCGTAAAMLETQIVPDVHAFEGHIACDPASRSEIVVPVFDTNRRLTAVLDLDSRDNAAFDEVDARYLEEISASMATAMDQPDEGRKEGSGHRRRILGSSQA